MLSKGLLSSSLGREQCYTEYILTCYDDISQIAAIYESSMPSTWQLSPSAIRWKRVNNWPILKVLQQSGCAIKFLYITLTACSKITISMKRSLLVNIVSMQKDNFYFRFCSYTKTSLFPASHHVIIYIV